MDCFDDSNTRMFRNVTYGAEKPYECQDGSYLQKLIKWCKRRNKCKETVELCKVHLKPSNPRQEIHILVSVLKKGLQELGRYRLTMNNTCPSSLASLVDIASSLDKFRDRLDSVYFHNSDIIKYSELLCQLKCIRCAFSSHLEKQYCLYKCKIPLIKCMLACFTSIEKKIYCLMTCGQQEDNKEETNFERISPSLPTPDVTPLSSPVQKHSLESDNQEELYQKHADSSTTIKRESSSESIICKDFMKKLYTKCGNLQSRNKRASNIVFEDALLDCKKPEKHHDSSDKSIYLNTEESNLNYKKLESNEVHPRSDTEEGNIDKQLYGKLAFTHGNANRKQKGNRKKNLKEYLKSDISEVPLSYEEEVEESEQRKNTHMNGRWKPNKKRSKCKKNLFGFKCRDKMYSDTNIEDTCPMYSSKNVYIDTRNKEKCRERLYREELKALKRNKCHHLLNANSNSFYRSCPDIRCKPSCIISYKDDKEIEENNYDHKNEKKLTIENHSDNVFEDKPFDEQPVIRNISNKNLEIIKDFIKKQDDIPKSCLKKITSLDRKSSRVKFDSENVAVHKEEKKSISGVDETEKNLSLHHVPLRDLLPERTSEDIKRPSVPELLVEDQTPTKENQEDIYNTAESGSNNSEDKFEWTNDTVKPRDKSLESISTVKRRDSTDSRKESVSTDKPRYSIDSRKDSNGTTKPRCCDDNGRDSNGTIKSRYSNNGGKDNNDTINLRYNNKGKESEPINDTDKGTDDELKSVSVENIIDMPKLGVIEPEAEWESETRNKEKNKVEISNIDLEYYKYEATDLCEVDSDTDLSKEGIVKEVLKDGYVEIYKSPTHEGTKLNLKWIYNPGGEISEFKLSDIKEKTLNISQNSPVFIEKINKILCLSKVWQQCAKELYHEYRYK